jgi:hypothetical protein
LADELSQVAVAIATQAQGRYRLVGASLFAALFSVVAPARAHADAGEVLLGAEVAGELASGAGLDVAAQLGVGDAVALRGWLGGGRYSVTHAAGAGSAGGVAAAANAFDAGVGVLWAWDVLSWVPELAVGGTVRVSATESVAAGLATVGLRRFVNADWSLSCTLGGGWRSTGEALGLARVGLWRRLR